MKFEELVRDGLVKRLAIDKKKVNESFEIAQRDLKMAEKILEEDSDWTFSIAYNSMLQAARALMFSKGYRPSGDAQHVAVVRFAELLFDKNSPELAIAFDRMRRKRHIAIYGKVGFVSKTEATNAVKHAKEFVSKIKEILKRNGFLE